MKNFIIKKSIAFLLIVVLCFAMSISAFATESEIAGSAEYASETKLTTSEDRGAPYANAWNMYTGAWRVQWRDFPITGYTIQLVVDGVTTYIFGAAGNDYQDFVATSVIVVSWY